MELNFTQWHQHIAQQLKQDYRKLKLIKNEKVIQKIQRRKPANLHGIQKDSISVNR
jgi:hypothetical protein